MPPHTTHSEGKLLEPKLTMWAKGRSTNKPSSCTRTAQRNEGIVLPPRFLIVQDCLGRAVSNQFSSTVPGRPHRGRRNAVLEIASISVSYTGSREHQGGKSLSHYTLTTTWWAAGSAANSDSSRSSGLPAGAHSKLSSAFEHADVEKCQGMLSVVRQCKSSDDTLHRSTIGASCTKINIHLS